VQDVKENYRTWKKLLKFVEYTIDELLMDRNVKRLIKKKQQMPFLYGLLNLTTCSGELKTGLGIVDCGLLCCDAM
jgi:hypothetical protein